MGHSLSKRTVLCRPPSELAENGYTYLLSCNNEQKNIPRAYNDVQTEIF